MTKEGDEEAWALEDQVVAYAPKFDVEAKERFVDITVDPDKREPDSLERLRQ